MDSQSKTRVRANKSPLVVDPVTSLRLSKIPQRNTKVEVLVRRVLHSVGFRFRLANRDLPGSPDVANRARRWAVFVHGCFWHRHKGCVRTTTPKRNQAFWVHKFRANQARDCRVIRALEQRGFRVLVVWECEAEADERALLNKLRRAVGR